MASGRRRFEIALQFAQSWLDLAREKPSSHTCRSARQPPRPPASAPQGSASAPLSWICCGLDAHYAVVDDAVTAWLTAHGRFAGA